MKKTRIILDEYTKKRNRLINQVKRSLDELKRQDKDIEIAIDKDVENMMGQLVNNVYLVSRWNGRITLQKHLFTYYTNPLNQQQ